MIPTNLDALVDELRPVPRLNAGHGLMLIAGATLAAALVSLLVLGPRPQLQAVFASTPGMIRSFVLLGLGAAASLDVALMARPRIGRSRLAGQVVLAATLVLPVAAVIFAAMREPSVAHAMAPHGWLVCLATIAGFAVGIGACIVAWLRRGAPINTARAGWLTGVAAGSLGAFAYSLHCPHGSLSAIAIWYSVAIAAAALAGRILVPPLIRW